MDFLSIRFLSTRGSVVKYGLALLLLCVGCRSPRTPYTLSGTAMTMAYTIHIGDPHPDPLLLAHLVETTFAEVDQIYNNWNPHSELSALNQLPAGKVVRLSPALATLLHKVEALVGVTEGRFDPTVAPLKKQLLQGVCPTPTSAVGWHCLHLEGDQFWKEYEETSLDLGGVAKGYAVDLLVERLQQAGYHHVYVSWGGEGRTAGAHPAGRPWRIAILGGELLELSSGAVATSGTYVQSWTIEGKRYTHLIDPRTQTTLDPDHAPFASATVLAPTCCEADALATALLLFPSLADAHSWATTHHINVKLYSRI